MPLHFSGNCVCVFVGWRVFLVTFLFLKETLRAVLGSGQYYLRDVFHAPHSHIYVAYLPERPINPREPAPAHQHPTSTFSWRDAHAYSIWEICPNGPCCTSLCFSLLLPLPPSPSSSLSLSSLSLLHSSPTDPWKPLFGFSAEFSRSLNSFSSICWPSTLIFSYFLRKMVLNKCCIFIPEVSVLRKNKMLQYMLKWNAN